MPVSIIDVNQNTEYNLSLWVCNLSFSFLPDLANLDIGSSIRISSVALPQNAELTITDRDFVVATIAAPTIVKEPEKPAEETAAEGAEGEAAATAEGGDATTAAKETGDPAKKEEKGKDAGNEKKQPDNKKTPPEKK